ncbi:Carbohydrate-binding WSC subgroup [Penicillium concentricum]|uniref:Carbohydrate-binding WSC subgroup n=1 Tax=Penicillium concentricum TaxID=293559 RepID=A0A9W9UZB7_9EURO|nr:Carbohydrate-binding WSC subgroup [Penicillium concentricum]KAJ5360700.1 Carbohydrate-binding WSC subgroup [Penicillium concentricum]
MKVPVVVSVFALVAPFASAASSLAFCASDNTGASFKAVSDIFQSNGACITTCANYALGILQGKKCWCSNVAPSKGSRSETSDCSTSCPGYPSDSCGSSSKGVFAYVEIPNNDVTSTAGGSSTSKTTSSSSSETTSTSSSTSSTSSDEKTTSTSATVSVQTNSGGQVKTITVAGSSSTAGSSADSASANASAAGSSGLSGGSIAGIVIGVIGGLALIGALIFMIFFYRKRARAVSPIPSQEMADDRTSRGSSFMGGLFPRGNGEGGAGGPVPARSGTTFTDRRMKTNTTLYPHGARDSSVSLQDNEDYSRPVLRLTNPD